MSVLLSTSVLLLLIRASAGNAFGKFDSEMSRARLMIDLHIYVRDVGDFIRGRNGGRTDAPPRPDGTDDGRLAGSPENSVRDNPEF
jgi:hypothetical protein